MCVCNLCFSFFSECRFKNQFSDGYRLYDSLVEISELSHFIDEFCKSHTVSKTFETGMFALFFVCFFPEEVNTFPCSPSFSYNLYGLVLLA